MIISRTPFRISFFGGGTDYPVWYRKHGGRVLSTTINKYCYINCRVLPPFFEHSLRVVYSSVENKNSFEEISHPSVRETLRYLGIKTGLEIHHDGDLPARSGLGSSSAFTVGLLHALYSLKGCTPFKKQLAEESIHIEQELIKETVGSQDQIAVAYGGLNRICFNRDNEFHVHPLTISHERKKVLMDHLTLFYTGVKRTASDVAKSYTSNTGARLDQLTGIGELVNESISVLKSDQDISSFGKLLHKAWVLKRSLSEKVSNGFVDKIYDIARNNGAIGGKLLGAGGGGFFLLFTPPHLQKRVRLALNHLIHVPFDMDNSGSQIIFSELQTEDYSFSEKERDNRVSSSFRELSNVEAFGRAVNMSISKKTSRRLYYDMLRIRRVQERIESLYLENEMRTPIHLCIGQEAVAVGVCTALCRYDYISSNHRGHGHYLAKGGDLKGLIAELYCKETGCAKGRGGSMHIVDTGVGIFGSSSIVGGGIPIGTGLGMSLKMKNIKGVSVVFFGDGAADEGVLYESINFAILKKLPVIFIFENNGYSVCSPVANRHAGKNIFHNTSPRQMFSALVDGNDVMAVYDAASKAVRRARRGAGPSFVECTTYRILGHAGCAAQDAKGYRTDEEVKHWQKKDPISVCKRKMMGQSILFQKDIEDFEEKIANEIDQAFLYAKKSPLPAGEDVGRFLYKE